MTEQEEKAIAAFDEEFEAPFEVTEWLTMRDSNRKPINWRGDVIKSFCAILNNRAEQQERIAQLEADKADMVKELRIISQCGSDNRYEEVVALVAEHEAK